MGGALQQEKEKRKTGGCYCAGKLLVATSCWVLTFWAGGGALHGLGTSLIGKPGLRKAARWGMTRAPRTGQYVNWGLGLENAILTPICALGAGKGHV